MPEAEDWEDSLMEPISGTRGKVSFNLKWQMLGTAAKHDQSPGGVWE